MLKLGQGYFNALRDTTNTHHLQLIESMVENERELSYKDSLHDNIGIFHCGLFTEY